MKITRTTYVGAFIIMMLLWAGCGSSSAPPVDLPAPITGRVDVSAPDENGDVTITGSEGAVTGGTIVQVVNESVAGDVSYMILDLLVPKAYAQTFPSVCEEEGHACTESAEDGSFQLTIPASVGDSLVIGLIDENGDWISDVIRNTVPESGTPDPEANCAGSGVTGVAVDIKVSPTDGIPVMLKQGSDTTTNQLVIGYNSPTVVSIIGCYAHSLDFYQNTTQGDAIAVTSKDDKILWAGRFVSGEIRDARSFDLDYEPMHIKFVEYSNKPLVAIRTASNKIGLAEVSTSSGTSGTPMKLLDGATSEVTGITRSLSLGAVSMESGEYLGLLLTDDGSNVNAYVTLFNADGPIHKGTWHRTELSASTAPDSIVDGVIYAAYVSGPPVMRFSFIDSAGAENVLKTFNIMTGIGPLEWAGDLSLSLVKPIQAGISTPAAGGTLKKVTVTKWEMTSPYAALVDDEGNLLTTPLGSDLIDVAASPWAPSGHTVSAIHGNEQQEAFYGADATADGMVDGSSDIYPTP